MEACHFPTWSSRYNEYILLVYCQDSIFLEVLIWYFQGYARTSNFLFKSFHFGGCVLQGKYQLPTQMLRKTEEDLKNATCILDTAQKHSQSQHIWKTTYHEGAWPCINLFPQMTGFCFLPQLFNGTLGNAAPKLRHSNLILSSWSTLINDIYLHTTWMLITGQNWHNWCKPALPQSTALP